MELKAIAFDIIGTTFDFFTSLGRGSVPLAARYGLTLDGPAYALAAEAGYADGVAAVSAGALWTPPDEILRDSIAAMPPVAQLGEPERSAAVAGYLGLWRTLTAWPEVPGALQALHERYTLAMLSNMSVATQAALRAQAGLPFDRTLSAEAVRQYKPSPAVYQMAVASLGVSPGEILMVAAHKYDLVAARSQGLRTAFVARPLELGPDGGVDTRPDPSFDFNATSFADLAAQLDPRLWPLRDNRAPAR